MARVGLQRHKKKTPGLNTLIEKKKIPPYPTRNRNPDVGSVTILLHD